MSVAIAYLVVFMAIFIIKINMKSKVELLLFLSTLFLVGTASSINEPISLAVTIYNDQFAMVKDTRSISFDQGRMLKKSIPTVDVGLSNEKIIDA
jgi:hypothetical protein